MIEADQVYRSYTLAKKKIEVLRGVNLKIESGEKVFCVVQVELERQL